MFCAWWIIFDSCPSRACNLNGGAPPTFCRKTLSMNYPVSHKSNICTHYICSISTSILSIISPTSPWWHWSPNELRNNMEFQAPSVVLLEAAKSSSARETLRVTFKSASPWNKYLTANVPRSITKNKQFGMLFWSILCLQNSRRRRERTGCLWKIAVLISCWNLDVTFGVPIYVSALDRTSKGLVKTTAGGPLNLLNQIELT